MNAPIDIPRDEHGIVRVFTLTIEAGGLGALRAPGALESALGVAGIDPEYVELFPVSDLAGVGLATYLIDGCGVPPEQIEPDRDRLEAITGHVMVVLSRAFGGRAVTLTPAAQLTLAGHYSETPTDWRADGPIETASARPTAPAHASTRPSPRAARARASRVGGTIFAVFMALIALILVLVVF